MFPMFDYTYFLFIAPGLILSLWASWRVKSNFRKYSACLLYTSPSPRDGLLSRMPSSA